jgi:hypothetical protein
MKSGQPRLRSVPVLVGIQLLAHLDAYSLQVFQGLRHLYGFRSAIEVLVLDLSVQRLSSFLR